MFSPNGHTYPRQQIRVVAFPPKIESLFPKPPGFDETPWPPQQFNYFDLYLKKLKCKTAVIESHYIDRDYVDDMALFYARSLRSYPNYCQRIHFFDSRFSSSTWKRLIQKANKGNRNGASDFLQKGYLGFMVVRPLPGTPIGRTVLKTYGPKTDQGHVRLFGAVREYAVHLAGFRLSIEGLAFQQQDQGVSACATTALWSAIQRIASCEGLQVATPAQITEGASRFILAGGRALPSEGLNLHQICEATREVGFAPLLVRSVDLAHDKAQLHGYIASGFAPVLAIKPLVGEGHAVCGVGVKLGATVPQTDPAHLFRDASSAVVAAYIHDDRLGPYACAELNPYTDDKQHITTSITLHWPDRKPAPDFYTLFAIIVPLPVKIRLTITRMRAVGFGIAQAVATIFPKLQRELTLNCRFTSSPRYLENSYSYGLSRTGIHQLVSETTMPRYLGLIELTFNNKNFCDVLIDSTEALVNGAVLSWVRRSPLTSEENRQLGSLAKNLGGSYIS